MNSYFLIGWLFPYVHKLAPTPLHSCDVTIGVSYAYAKLAYLENLGFFFSKCLLKKISDYDCGYSIIIKGVGKYFFQSI